MGVVRIAGLVHDLGHLPYSHIFESTLDNFLQYFKTPQAENLNLMGGNQEELRELHTSLEETFSKKRNPDDKIHEIIRDYLIDLLLYDSEFREQEANFGYEAFLRGAKAVWENEAQKFDISRSILDGDIDADRIDFVARDGLFSGLYIQRPIDFDRILSFYEIGELEDDNKIISLKGRPNYTKSASHIENLIWHRYHDYKYIVAHHKVRLFDEILNRLLYFMITDLTLSPLLRTIIGLGTIQTMVEKYRKLPDRKVMRNEEERDEAKRKIKTQIFELKHGIHSTMNDSWIDIQLAITYKKLLERHSQLMKHRENDEEVVDGVDKENDEEQLKLLELRMLLHEAFSERRDLFKSLFKSDEAFLREFHISHSPQDEANPYQPDLAEISNTVNRLKWIWEAELGERERCAIIIGDVYNILDAGLDFPHFYGLGNLGVFLLNQRLNSMPFNVWYSGTRGMGLEKRIVEFLMEKLREKGIEYSTLATTSPSTEKE